MKQNTEAQNMINGEFAEISLLQYDLDESFALGASIASISVAGTFDGRYLTG